MIVGNKEIRKSCERLRITFALEFLSFVKKITELINYKEGNMLEKDNGLFCEVDGKRFN